jgi:hypothetical protein
MHRAHRFNRFIRRGVFGAAAITAIVSLGHAGLSAAHLPMAPPPGLARALAPSCAANPGTGPLPTAVATEEMRRRLAADPALAAAVVRSAERFRHATPLGWTVVALKEPKAKAGPQPPAGLEPHAVVTDDHFVIAWYSYDDGDNTTWKGTVYVATADGDQGTWNQQLDLGHGKGLKHMWSQNTWFKPAPRKRPAGLGLPGWGDAHVVLTDLLAGAPPDRKYPLRPAPDWYGYYGCSSFWCGGAALGCAAMGPGAPGCFVAGCTTSLVGCAWGTLFG